MKNVNRSAVSIRYPRSDYPNTTEIPDEFESDDLPVEPDQGPVRTYIPEDPEHDRVVDPGVHELPQTQGRGLYRRSETEWLL